MPSPSQLPLVLGVTGASGAVYAVRLLEVLCQQGRGVHLTISPSAAVVIAQELHRKVDLDSFRLNDLLGESWEGDSAAGDIVYHHYQDFFAPIASGSFLTGGMMICPCSGGTLSAVASGSGGNLIHRAADVHLKEGRKLILTPRETPLSRIHLQNMTRAHDAGAVILPASPGWYHGVRRIEDLVDFLVARILDQLGVAHELGRRWSSS